MSHSHSPDAATFGSLPPELADLLEPFSDAEATVLDHNDRYVYFTQYDPPIFARSPEILGEDVLVCHSPASHEAIRELLAALRAGREQERSKQKRHPVYGSIEVRYLALRDGAGSYRGCAELVRPLEPRPSGTVSR